MSQLRSDVVLRAALVVDVVVDGRLVSVAGTHMSHMHYGSHRNWAELRDLLKTGAAEDAVLLGDMNTWGPLVVSLFMPGWKRAVVGKTWPAWRPHSQIDHILVRGRCGRCGVPSSRMRGRTTGRCRPSWRWAECVGFVVFVVVVVVVVVGWWAWRWD